jgi:hypothetical protein
MSQVPKNPLTLRTSPRLDFPVFEDPTLRRFRLEDEAALEPGFLDLFAAGVNQEWVPFAALRYLRKGLAADDDPEYPGFSQLPKETQDALVEGIPVDQRHPIQMAFSLRQAELISSNLRRLFEAEQMLNDAGAVGLVARLAAALTDPFAIAVGVTTGGMGNVLAKAKLGRKLTILASAPTRGRRALKSGLIAGAENLGIEAALLIDNPTKSPTDLLFAFAAGGTLGGGASILTGRTLAKTQRAAQRFTENILALDAQKIAQETGTTLTQRGAALLAEYSGTKKGEDLFASVLHAAGLDPDDMKFYLDILKEGDGDLDAALGKLVSAIPDAPLPQKIGMTAEQAVKISFARAAAAGRSLTADDVGKLVREFGVAGAAPDASELSLAERVRLEEAAGEEVNIILPKDKVTMGDHPKRDQEATITSIDVEGGTYFATDQDGNEFSFGANQASRAGKMLGEPQDISALIDPTDVDLGKISKPPPPRDPAEAGDVSFFGRSSAILGRGLNAVAISMAGRLVRNPAASVRRLVSILAQNAIPQKGLVQAETASEGAFRHSQVRLGRFWSEARPAYNDWAKGQNLSFFEKRVKTNKFDEFFNEVGKAVRRAVGEYSENVHINQVADHIREQMKEMLIFGQRHGVKGLEQVEVNPNYLPRIWSIEKIHSLDQTKGAEWFVGALTKALLDANPTLKEDLAKKWARGMNLIIRNTDKYTDLQRSQIFNSEATELMREAMSDAGMAAGDVESIMRLVAPRKSATEGTSRAKKRNYLNETTEYEGTSLEEAMENNAATLMTLYSKQIVGASMMSKVLQEMSRVTGREMVTTGRLMDFLGKEMTEAGMSDTARNSAVGKIETMIRSIEGKRIHSATKHSELLANLRAYNFLRVGGQFGIAQLPEFGSIFGTVGLGAIVRQMPAFGQALKLSREGKVSNQLIHEWEAIIGAGTNWKNSEVLSRVDVDGQLNEMGKTANRALRRLGRGMGAANFMTPITTMQERMVINVVSQAFFDRAVRGRSFGKARLASLGLTEEDGRKIVSAIRKYASRQDSAVGGPRLVRVNFDQWGTLAADAAEELDEIEAASRLIGAVQRWSGRAVQKNDIGNLSYWMTTDSGRIISQFKTFGLVAWDKQFLARTAMVMDGLNMREPELAYHSFMEATLSSGFAAMAYSLRTYTNSFGRDDREEFLKDALSPKKLAIAAVQQSAWASFLPDIADNIFWMAGQEESVFTNRTSGLPTVARTGALLANPSFDMITGLGKFAHAASTTAWGDDFTKAEYKNAVKLIPGIRLTHMITIADLVAGERGLDLPDE